MTAPRPEVTIVSFGYGHGGPPPAHAVYDVRHHFKDPHVRPGLRGLTAEDPAVTAAVTGTPGVQRLVVAIALAVQSMLDGPQPGPVTVAVGCAGGRHRSAVIAERAAARLRDLCIPVTVTHRDMHRPVIERPARAAAEVPDAER